MILIYESNANLQIANNSHVPFRIERAAARSGFSHTGFTLIELLIVISIIGIMVVISFGAFKSLQPSLKLGSAVRDLVTDLRSVQQSAVTEQVRYGIHFSTSTNQYQMIRFGATPQQILTKSLPQGITFEEVNFTEEKVVFNPYGATEEPGEVSLSNIKGEVKTVEVRPSGFVKVNHH